MSYGLKTDYNQGTPVVPADLNRRGDVLQAQLPGAFRALGAGVLGEDDLLVTDEIAAGRAIIEGADGVLVYVEVPDSLPIPGGDEAYLLLALRVPEFIGGPGDTRGTSSQRGAPPRAILSDDPSEPDALLLSTRVGGLWTDTRVKSRLTLLEADVMQLETDLGYDGDERATGTVAARLGALERPLPGGGEGEIPNYGAAINALTQRVATLEGLIADMNAKIAALGGAADLFPQPFAHLADETALNRAGIAEVNRHAIERGQISVVVRGAGHGQFDTPDYTPDTGDVLEVPWHADGTFGP